MFNFSHTNTWPQVEIKQTFSKFRMTSIKQCLFIYSQKRKPPFWRESWRRCSQCFWNRPSEFKEKPKIDPKTTNRVRTRTSQRPSWSNRWLAWFSGLKWKLWFLWFPQLLLVILPSSFPWGDPTSKQPEEPRKRLQTSASAPFSNVLGLVFLTCWDSDTFLQLPPAPHKLTKDATWGISHRKKLANQRKVYSGTSRGCLQNKSIE